MKTTVKIGISGVRGIVGESFTPQLALSFAQAFGNLVGSGRILVGRDTRSSGLMIEQAVIAGLQSVGCRPVMMGIIPTPTLLFLIHHLGYRGGIIITASHNPVEWNALKFADRLGMFLDSVHAEELFDIYHQDPSGFVTEPELRRPEIMTNPTEAHFERISKYVDVDLIRKRNFKVAVDCCNGVGAVFTANFLRDVLGCEVHAIFDTPTGVFERTPEPLPENLSVLGECVRANQCDVGFAQDPDGDRLAMLSEDGDPIGEDKTVMFAIEQVLQYHSVGPVVCNLSMSKAVEDIVQRYNAELIHTPTGEIHVSKMMIERGAVVGGEHTGGIIIPAIHPCRDSYSGMAVILERMAMTNLRPSQMSATLRKMYYHKEKIAIKSEESPRILRSIRHHYASEEVNVADGIHVDFGDRWVHVRRSNTEPVMRLIAEATSEESLSALLKVLREIIQNARSCS